MREFCGYQHIPENGKQLLMKIDFHREGILCAAQGVFGCSLVFIGPPSECFTVVSRLSLCKIPATSAGRSHRESICNLSSMQVYYCHSAVPGSSIGVCDFCGIVEPCSTCSACIPLIVCSAFEDIGFVLPRLVQHDGKSWDSIERD